MNIDHLGNFSHTKLLSPCWTLCRQSHCVAASCYFSRVIRHEKIPLYIRLGNTHFLIKSVTLHYISVMVGKLEGRRPLGRPRRRWVDNIRMDPQEVGGGYMDCTGLAQDRDRWRTFVSAVMNLRVPWNAGNFLTSCRPVSCSRRALHRGVSE